MSGKASFPLELSGNDTFDLHKPHFLSSLLKAVTCSTTDKYQIRH